MENRGEVCSLVAKLHSHPSLRIESEDDLSLGRKRELESDKAEGFAEP